MKQKLTIKLLGVLAFASMGNVAFAVALTDTIDWTDNASQGTFFLPPNTSPTTSPYYRGKGEDWGWQHNAIAGTPTSAGLSISAWDVDASSGEVDIITAGGISLGSLEGNNNIFAFTTFDLTPHLANPAFLAEINSGLNVFMEIDTQTNGSWLVTLAKSSLTVDGGTLPNPNPVPDSGSTLALLGGLLVGFRPLRRFFARFA